MAQIFEKGKDVEWSSCPIFCRSCGTKYAIGVEDVIKLKTGIIFQDAIHKCPACGVENYCHKIPPHVKIILREKGKVEPKGFLSKILGE